MNETRPQLEDNKTDAAALLAAALAIVLTTYMDEAAYDIFSALVSGTLVWTLLAYLGGRPRSVPQRVAFAAVGGLTSTPLSGLVIELINNYSAFDLLPGIGPERSVKWVEENNRASRVGDVPLAIAWFTATALIYWADAKLAPQQK